MSSETLTTHGSENQGIMYSAQVGLLALNFVPIVGQALDVVQAVGMAVDHIDPEGYNHVLTRDGIDNISSIIYNAMNNAMISNIPSCSNLIQNAVPSINKSIADDTCKSLMQVWKPSGPDMSSIESCYGNYNYPKSISRSGPPKSSCPSGYSQYYNKYYNDNISSYKTNNIVTTPNNIVKSLPIPITIVTTTYNYTYLIITIVLCSLLTMLVFIMIIYNI
ncbi:MAG: hypothetical protein PHG66_01645 [Candidatus Colwellbacteria bacterium]|nr:hypothetical protein [Candidatus Colwellbacteria bacterium]